HGRARVRSMLRARRERVPFIAFVCALSCAWTTHAFAEPKPDEEPAPREKEEAEAQRAQPPPPPPPPAPAGPSPFVFTMKGFISGTMYAQDASFLSGNGNGAIFGPGKLESDKWFLSGDVRQTQVRFM